jgi:hypothetical protein
MIDLQGDQRREIRQRVTQLSTQTHTIESSAQKHDTLLRTRDNETMKSLNNKINST